MFKNTLLLFFMAISIATVAQKPQKPTYISPSDSNSVIIDKARKIYSYEEFKKHNIFGHFLLKPIATPTADGKHQFLIVDIPDGAIVKTDGVKAFSINANSIVRGEDGLIYPTAIWRKLISTGDYAIKRRGVLTEQGEYEYLMYKLSDDYKKIMLEKMPKPHPSESFIEGSEFKGFKVSDLNGNKFDVREAKGKVLVLNFWFINCPPCRTEIPPLNELRNQYRENPNVIFLAICTDEKYDIQDFIKTNPFTYNIIDGGRYLAQKYDVKVYPTHAVIDKDGKVKFGSIGLAANTISWIKKSIDEALAVN